MEENKFGEFLGLIRDWTEASKGMLVYLDDKK